MDIQEIVRSIRSKKPSFSGMIGASPAAMIASLKADYQNLFVIVASMGEAEALRSELGIFSQDKVSLFPAPETIHGSEPAGERLAVLDHWHSGEKGTVIAPIKAVMVMTLRKLTGIRVSGDQEIRLEKLIEQLIHFGYKRFDIVGERGEFSVKGGIVDIYPLHSDHPVRIELSGDKVESLRYFDPFSQRSIEKLTKINILPARELEEVPIFDHLPADTAVIFVEMLQISSSAENIEEIRKMAGKFRVIELSSFLQPGEEVFFSSAPGYVNKLNEIPKNALIISKHAARIKEELEVEAVEGSIRGGFVFNGITVLSDRELFGEEVVFRRKKAAAGEGVADELLADLKPGDHVVHENYGIALYKGMETLEIDKVKQEYLLLEFAEGDKVFVPPSMAGLVEKYSSGGDFHPKLSRLGTKQWLRTKNQVKKELRDMTEELLKLYAARQKLPGTAYPPDDIWQAELEGTFPYEETPDQRKAISETKRDMESPRPMDRLICGDVGYGKTEVAIRAAAKAVAAGKQAAILVPTTILADQHYNNFKSRFSALPFVVEMLSRFRSKKEQAEIVRSLAAGGVDIVIGTHRLLSKDIKFKELGLLIIDEEQRFGVAHKEKLKRLRQTVDVLTLSATPIPRTLYMSLSGARDLSTINTPPVDRSPVRTYVLPWNEAVVREAILREIDRRGQVFFVHNIVETIEGMAAKIKRLVPEARVVVAHGQMDEKALENTMLRFLNREFDVLVCTAIIESGLDITNVNTIFIDNADRFGLSQLYQLRGRVGRSAARAHAYLFYHPERVMTDTALERLKAIQEFTALGSGYKLAMRDLEIRGAGNLLGAEQSGHIMEVGFDLYCELLDEAVKEIKGIQEPSPRGVEIDLKIEAYIPEEYVTDDRQRIALYRRMNLISDPASIEDIKKEIRDRFGPIPAKLSRLFDILYLKVKALKAGVVGIKEEGGKLYIENVSGKMRRIDVVAGDKVKLAEKYIPG